MIIKLDLFYLLYYNLTPLLLIRIGIFIFNVTKEKYYYEI